MEKISPQGNTILVLPIKKENTVSEGNIEMVSVLNHAEVVEVSENFNGVYEKGDVVLLSDGAGRGYLYNGKMHQFVDGRGMYDGGDVWAVYQKSAAKTKKGK